MNKEEVNVVKAFEEQLREEEEFERKKKLDKEYNEAKESATFNVFNAIIGVIGATASAAFCAYFLWKNNKILLLIVTVLIAASLIFGILSKKHFAKGNRKKFETYNRLSGATGVASSIFELADMRNSKSRGALSKADNVGSAISKAVHTVSEVQYKGGTYTDKKYDSMRERAIGMGKYIYRNNKVESLYKLIEQVDVVRKKGKLNKSDNVKLSVFGMYVKDVLNKSYGEIDDLFYASIGSLYYFLHPLTELPDDVPLVGYKDNMFIPYCVYSGYDEDIDKYKRWRINTTKAKMVEDAMQNVDAIWVFMCKANLCEAHSIDELIELSINYVNNNRDVGKDIIDAVLILSKMLQAWYSGNFTDVTRPEIDGIINTLGYLLLEDDVVPDGISALGYVDDFVIIKCCLTKCSGAIKDFGVWEELEKLRSENDPLVEYLNTLIGDNEKMREAEIKRLSKLCRFEEIKDIKDRARSTVVDLQI